MCPSNRLKNELPIIKATFDQGRIIGQILTAVSKKPIRSVSQVIQEMKPKYIEDYIRRGGVWPSEPKRQQKRIDTEHTYVTDFCKAFDLLSYQGQEVMLTFFGRKILKVMEEYGSDNIFDDVISDCLGKIMLYVDCKNWNILGALRDNPDGLSNLSLMTILNEKGIGIDIASLRRRLKERLRKEYRKEWRSNYGNRPVDWVWMENKLRKKLESKTTERLTQIIESILRFFKHVGVVVKKDDAWYIDQTRFDNLQNVQYWRDINSVSYNEFSSAVLESFKFWTKKLGASDVPLPLIRNNVCWKLNIPWDFFDSILQDAPLKHKNIMLSFSQSRFPKKWGIVKHNKSLYYLNIQLKE